jgi:uncharacterized protein (TIGR02147 family)
VIADTKPRRGVVSRLAEAAGCRPSYLSQVLGSAVQLTPDQALGLAEFLGLSEAETEYWLGLVDHSRAGTPRLRKRIEIRLGTLRERHEDLTVRLRRPAPESSEDRTLYYSSWTWSAIHILTSVPRFQTLLAIAQALGLDEATTLEHLTVLERMGFVIRSQESGVTRWKNSRTEVHVPRDSPLISLHHNNWRQMAVLRAQRRPTDSVHFTGIYAISRSDFERLKEMLRQLITEVNRVAVASPDETLICFTSDLFAVA